MVTFKFREYPYSLFRKIKRPVADILIQSQIDGSWQSLTLIVDTGADYTLFPKFLSTALGIDLDKDCKRILTKGVGGDGDVYMLKKKISVKVREYERQVPIGFLDNDNIPPLMGRREFFETFRVLFENWTTSFEEPSK